MSIFCCINFSVAFTFTIYRKLSFLNSWFHPQADRTGNDEVMKRLCAGGMRAGPLGGTLPSLQTAQLQP